MNYPGFNGLMARRNTFEQKLSPAQITEPPKDVKVIAGDTAVFLCRAKGNPTPTVTFLLDRSIPSAANFRANSLIPDGSVLRLTGTRMEQDRLQVQCVARNHVGGDMATAHLRIYDANENFPEGYPLIRVAPKAIKASVGGTAQLDCEVTGFPLPTVMWFKNEAPIPIDYTRTSLIGTGTLKFAHVRISDEGHYECLVRNPIGSVLSAKAYLGIKNTHSAPNIMEKVDRIHVRPGHGANLSCHATGNPIPLTRWLTDHESPITEFQEGVAILHVADITESTRYICEANNSLGTVQHPVRIDVLEVPSPPLNLRCLEEGPSHVFLQWYPPIKSRGQVENEHLIDTYTLFLTENEDSGKLSTGKQITDISAEQYHPDGALQYKVVNLKPFTQYSAEVTAISNLLGMSDPSNTVFFRTTEIAPGSPPNTIRSYALSDDTIQVDWESPSQPNGKIIRYTIFYTHDVNLPINRWNRIETNLQHAKIRNLKKSLTYYVKIAAVNSVDVGPLSEALPTIVKYGVPSQPINLHGVSISPSQIYLNWTAPQLAEGVLINEYSLQYCDSISRDRGVRPSQLSIPSKQTSFVLDGLKSNQTYHISLAATTSYGIGTAAQVKVLTGSTVPQMPVLHELEILDSSRIRIRWLSPEQTESSIANTEFPFQINGEQRPSSVIYYLVQWTAFPFSDWDERRIEAKLPHSRHTLYEIVIGGLLTRTSYRIRISAVGPVGVGPPLELGPVLTKGQVPSAPRNLRLNQLRRALPPGIKDKKHAYAVLELAWDPPERSHGDLHGYQVTHRLIGPPEALLSHHAPSAMDYKPPKSIRRNVTQTAYTSTFSDQLKFGHVYQFEVAAYNGVDLGLPAQLNISTPEDAPENYPIHIRLNGLSSTSIEVTWLPPMKRKTDDSILHYQVRYFQPSRPNQTEFVLNSNEPRLVLENLADQTFYTVMVRAISESGSGPWSLPSTIQTTAELPEPPLQLIGKRINSHQIKVTWDTLHSGQRIPITGFRLFYAKKSKRDDLATWKILDVGPVTMATLDELEPTVEYWIKIKSRGVDGRFGTTSEPIVVGSYISDESTHTGTGMIGSGSISLNQNSIPQISCHWTTPLDTAKQSEASLKLNWEMPTTSTNIYQFQIQLLGTKSFIDETNQPRRIIFDPRTLDVPFDRIKSPSYTGPYHDVGGDSLNRYSLIVDELSANTIYDVQIRPIYQPNSVDQAVGRSIPSVAQTSCRTMMLPPVRVPSPIPVAIKQQTGQVVIRVFRVSESLGRIRRYYLILSKTSALIDFETSPVNREAYWRNKLGESTKLWAPDTFVAAEFNSEVFEQSQMELLLSSPNYLPDRIQRAKRTTFFSTESQLESIVGRKSKDRNILIHGRHISKNEEYRAFVLVCVYPNEDSLKQTIEVAPFTQPYPTHPYTQSTSKTSITETTTPLNLCTASAWSIPFNPSKPIKYPDPDGNNHEVDPTKKPTEDPYGRVKGQNTKTAGKSDILTVAIIVIIVGLGIVAIICIAVGCFMRRRKPKCAKRTLTVSVGANDDALKTPLMNSKATTNFGEINGKLETSLDLFHTIDPVRSTATTTGSTTDSYSPAPVKIHSAIGINQLVEHVAMLKQDNGLEMSDEYESIETGVGLTWQHANLEENRPKNRYANVIAYDHSRVMLTTIPSQHGSDYINANFIDGYQRQKAYIATQGPLPETFHDFWRMIWEQNSRIIVMMTKLEERARVKCDQYWPGRGEQIYSANSPHQIPSYTVSIKDCSVFAYFTVRTFILKEIGSNQSSCGLTTLTSDNEVREVKQIQFTAWPDYGTPDHAQPLLLFVRRVNQIRNHMVHQIQQERIANGDSLAARAQSGQEHIRPTSPVSSGLVDLGPTIVHCSAGVGRTGAFIVIDSQLERLKVEKSVDIFGSVGRMRSQRNFMVQTEEQYTFLYDTFVEATTVYGTEVTAHGLYNHVVKLRQTTPVASHLQNKDKQMVNDLVKDGQSGLELEFVRIPSNLMLNKQSTSALLQENRTKNRTMDIMPFEANRVSLPLIRGIDGSDYINASFVDGYRKQRAYIATQTPLLNTADDFWRMIWEYDSPIIVMLTGLPVGPPGTLENHPDVYWPMERSTRYQHLLVEPMVEYNMPHFVLREFRLTDTRDGQSRTVRQFQLHGWPQDVNVPKSAEAIIDLIGQVHKTQTQFGQDGPITVHCNTGSGRTGVFINLCLLLGRMRCEGMVDVFLSTRMLRTQRTGMVSTLDQYAFCYAAALEYLASFDHYTS